MVAGGDSMCLGSLLYGDKKNLRNFLELLKRIMSTSNGGSLESQHSEFMTNTLATGSIEYDTVRYFQQLLLV